MAARKKDSKRKARFHGVLLVDKPMGVTSHDVVNEVRRLFETRRVGHTGTLDPQATGLLVLLVGEATKISEFLIGADKSYEGKLRFGVVSDTYDASGEVVPGPGGKIPATLEELTPQAAKLTGEIEQVPPPYSAKKVGGKKLYEYARAGEKPEVPSRRVRVDNFELLEFTGENELEFGVDCSSGTYVRSLVHELGQLAGCGAVLTELHRTDAGPFRIEDAKTLETLKEMEMPERKKMLIPIQDALPGIPSGYMTGGAESWLRRGQAIPFSMVEMKDGRRPPVGGNVVLCRMMGDAVAICRVDPAPLSPPPRAMMGAPAPWFHPLKQFDMPAKEAADEEE